MLFAPLLKLLLLLLFWNFCVEGRNILVDPALVSPNNVDTFTTLDGALAADFTGETQINVQLAPVKHFITNFPATPTFIETMVVTGGLGTEVACTNTNGGLRLTPINSVTVQNFKISSCLGWQLNGVDVTVSNMVVSGGSANIGGGLETSSTNLLVQNTLFVGNLARQQGGAITIDLVQNALFQNVTFDTNSAQQGGCVFMDVAKQTITFDSCTFTSNEAFQTPGTGAIIDAFDATVIIKKSTFKLNRASVAGSIFLNSGSLTIEDSTFDGNTATNFGGAVAVNTVNVVVQRSTFRNNGAAFGAAFSLQGSGLNIANSFVNDNTNFGIGCNSSSLAVTTSSISGNGLPDVFCDQCVSSGVTPDICSCASGKLDACSVCDGNGQCVGCDNVAYSNKVLDNCSVCGGDGSTCKLNIAAIAGGAVGGFVLVPIVAVAAFFIVKKRREKSYNSSPQKNEYGHHGLGNNPPPHQPSIPPKPFNPLASSNDINLAKIEGSIQPSELKLSTLIGSGSFGDVYRGEWRMVSVAVKKLKEDSLGTKEFCDELNVMRKLKPHPNIVQFLGFSKTQDDFMLVMELCENGNLEDWLRSYMPDDNYFYQFIYGIALGMLHLAKEGFVHRDLSARNVLLDKKFNPKISDFGFAKYIGQQSSAQTKSDFGPVKWMAPETINAKSYSEKSDVWSFGVTVWEILNQQRPYPGFELLKVADLVSQGKLYPTIPKEPQYYVYANLMSRCFSFYPKDRPDFAEICWVLRDAAK